MKIALAEDNAMNRSNFIQKVATFPDLEISVLAVDGHDFLEKIKGLPAHQFPVVVFMDIQMPGLTGIDTIKLAKALHPSMHFIVLTVFEDDETIFEAIEAGAS